MINIVDGIPGQGKTSFAIQLLNNSIDTNYFGEMDFEPGTQFVKNFLYVTPYIDEVERIEDSIEAEIVSPNSSDYASKYQALKHYILSGKSVVTTHKLFLDIKEDLIPLIQEKKYTLILDEVIEVAKTINITKSDINILKNSKSIEIENNGKVNWKNKDYGDETSRFWDIKEGCMKEKIYSNKEHSIFLNLLSPKLFNSFQNIYILTYLFEGQTLSYYFKYFDLEYSLYTVIKNKDNEDYKLTTLNRNLEDRTFIKALLNIYEDRQRARGPKSNINFNEHFNALSSSWFDKASEEDINQLKLNLDNYFKNKIKCQQDELYWTTLKKKAPKLTKSKCKYNEKNNNFLSLNIKATNKYKDRIAAAYVYNRFMITPIYNFFKSWGYTPDQNLFAVSELIQFLFRGCIREGKQLNCYIPSLRMRELLYKWLNHEL